MPLFADRHVKAVLGKPQSVPASEARDRHQLVPIVFRLPLNLAGEYLAHDLKKMLEGAGRYLVAPVVQGDLGIQEIGPYTIAVWPHSDEPNELKVHLSCPPDLVVDLVEIPTVKVKSTDEEFLIGAKMIVPWKDKDQAGEVDALAGHTVQLKLVEHQVGLGLDRFTEAVMQDA